MPVPAQRHDGFGREEDDASRTSDAAPVASQRSYVGELAARFGETDEFGDDDAGLTVPPGQVPAPWVASDIHGALTAVAETVPRSSSSPDAPVYVRSTVPAAEVPGRAVRRPRPAVVDEFPVQLECESFDHLAEHRSASVDPLTEVDLGWRATVDDGGSIAAVVARLVHDERGDGAVQAADDPTERSARAASAQHAVGDLGVGCDAHQAVAIGDVTVRAVVLLASALITGATLLAVVLRGLG